MSLEVNIKKIFKGFSMDISFNTQGETMGILGASGAGKSMTLKCIAGIEKPDSGRIVLGDRVLFDSEEKINLTPQERKVGYLFQNYALFPNMTVSKNITFALKLSEAEKKRKEEEMLSLFRLEGLANRYPSQLSGGQQQRAAIARILACNPDAILLDEPFSALDYYLKEELEIELLEWLEKFDRDVILVTHNRDEAYRICDTLLTLDNGESHQKKSTKDVFANPEYLSVAKITGCKNFSPAKIISDYKVEAADWNTTFTFNQKVPIGTNWIGIRAHSFFATNGEEAENTIPVSFTKVLDDPFEKTILFSAGDKKSTIWWKVAKNMKSPEEVTHLAVKSEDIFLLK